MMGEESKTKVFSDTLRILVAITKGTVEQNKKFNNIYHDKKNFEIKGSWKEEAKDRTRCKGVYRGILLLCQVTTELIRV